MRLIFLTILLSLFLTAAPAPAPASNAEFIRLSCENTLHPELCYQSLKRYANVVKKELPRLAKVAISLSLTRNKFMSSYVENLTRQAQPEPRAAVALSDCASQLGNGERDMRNSVKQMKRLSGSGKELENVLMLISAARTYQEDCTDGLERVSNSSALIGRVEPGADLCIA